MLSILSKSSLALLLLFFNAITVMMAQGLRLDDSVYTTIPQKIVSSTPSNTKLPVRVDLSKYAPSVKNQGELGTCVAFSTTYYLRTILEAIKKGITDKARIDELSFSPSYLYNQIKDSTDYDCLHGTSVELALEFLKTKGAAKLSEQDYPNCNQNTTIALREDSKILDYVRLFSLIKNEDKVYLTKKALSENTPVVIGIQTTFTLDELGFWEYIWHKILSFFGWEEDDFGLWKPKDSDLRSGHAVCLVGYDDQKFGKGAFRAINSRGSYWGDDGFFWIAYDDYITHAKYAYQAYLPENQEKNETFSGEVSFLLEPYNSDNELPFVRSASSIPQEKMIAYQSKEAVYSETKYRLRVEVGQRSYLYVLVENENQGITATAFPEVGLSEIMEAHSPTILPADYELTPPTGREYTLFLFSNHPLPIATMEEKINSEEGSFIEKVQKAFGSELISFDKVNYDKRKMRFETMEKQKAGIVPMLVSLKHIPKPIN